MRELMNRITDVDQFIEFDPSELAGHIILALKEMDAKQGNSPKGKFNRNNLLNGISGAGGYPKDREDQIFQAFCEAWAWLENNGFLIASPSDTSGIWVSFTRKALDIRDTDDFKSVQQSLLYPAKLMHPKIHAIAWPNFARGRFDAAIFEAMKEVEVSVRNAGNYSPKEIGVSLMRQAFHPENGKLTDLDAPPGEREGLMALFVGAIASYKNPYSHRYTDFNDAQEAIEVLLLAGHLLRIIETRGSGRV